jgi:hypothetical protein
MSSFDSNWTLSISSSNLPISDASSEPGMFIGNGKIGIITTFEKKIDVARTMITSELKYGSGGYRANIIEPFYVNNIKLFDNKENSVTYSPTSQHINMFNAVFTCSQIVSEVATGKSVSLEYDIFTPRQLPFCIMQTVRITPTSSMPHLDLFHEVYAKDNIVDAEYNNNVIYNESISPNKGLYILTGKGRTRLSEDVVVSATGYLIELPENEYGNLGFNVYRSDPNRCYNKFRLNNLMAGTTYKVHLVSALMTSFDFSRPLEEVKRIVLGIASKADTAVGVANTVRSDHTYQWTELWRTDITVTPKTGITMSEADEINTLKRHMRTSLYNIYSTVRENVNVEVNPLNLSVIDYDGSVLFDGDLWLIPLLLMIKTDIARTLLEYRHNMMTTARQLAASHGYKGSKFPYINDSVGYRNALYWDTAGPMAVFNTALISINVWNYFRISKDKDWLRTKGYSMLKDNADFFASKVQQDPDGTYHLRNVVGIGGLQSSDHNTFTNNLVRLALRCAIESSFELSYPVKEAWNNCYHNLPFLYHTNTSNLHIPEVLKYDAGSSSISTYDILEPLFALTPYYNKLYFAPELYHSSTSILKNLEFYETLAKPGMENHPFNIALTCTLYGNYTQYDPTYAHIFKRKLGEYLDTHVHGKWGHLSKDPMKNNDLVLSAILLFMVLQGATQMKIVGGVAESRFYYEDMRLTAPTSANMPHTWRNVRVTNTGINGKAFIVTNSLYYVGTP